MGVGEAPEQAHVDEPPLWVDVSMVVAGLVVVAATWFPWVARGSGASRSAMAWGAAAVAGDLAVISGSSAIWRWVGLVVFALALAGAVLVVATATRAPVRNRLAWGASGVIWVCSVMGVLWCVSQGRLPGAGAWLAVGAGAVLVPSAIRRWGASGERVPQRAEVTRDEQRYPEAML